jgi:hypothetical protein
VVQTLIDGKYRSQRDVDRRQISFSGTCQRFMSWQGVLKDQVQHLLLYGAAMAKNYKHLTTQERAVVMIMRDDQCV